MAYEGEHNILTIKALEALDTHQYQAVALDDGLVANDGKEAGGILQNKPKINEHASLSYLGERKFRAGLAITLQKAITVTTSGYFITAGSGTHIVGRALATVTSGSIGTGLFNFITPVYAANSQAASF